MPGGSTAWSEWCQPAPPSGQYSFANALVVTVFIKIRENIPTLSLSSMDINNINFDKLNGQMVKVLVKE